jgi:hypothetical protein
MCTTGRCRAHLDRAAVLGQSTPHRDIAIAARMHHLDALANGKAVLEITTY